VSELKNPRFGPDISVLTTQVNFHVTIEGLEEQMLSIVITNQKSDLEEESVKMRKEALSCIKILKKLEDDILDSLNRRIEDILTDEKLIETLENSKKTSR
jgi:dynein heavy chain